MVDDVDMAFSWETELFTTMTTNIMTSSDKQQYCTDMRTFSHIKTTSTTGRAAV